MRKQERWEVEDGGGGERLFLDARETSDSWVRTASAVVLPSQARPMPAGQQVPEPKGMGTGSGQRRKKKWKKKLKRRLGRSHRTVQVPASGRLGPGSRSLCAAAPPLACTALRP